MSVADRFAAIPFVGQGRDYDGCDCWGLVFLWFRDALGVALESYDDIAATDAAAVNAMIERDKLSWVTVPRDAVRDNDVAVMRSLEPGHLSDGHLGVVVEQRKVMHTQQGIGVQVERLSAPHIASRIIEFRRHPLLA